MTTSPGAALAAQRRIVAHICAHCGSTFQGIKKAVYCSERCKQAAKYRRAKR